MLLQFKADTSKGNWPRLGYSYMVENCPLEMPDLLYLTLSCVGLFIFCQLTLKITSYKAT